MNDVEYEKLLKKFKDYVASLEKNNTPKPLFRKLVRNYIKSNSKFSKEFAKRWVKMPC